MTNPPTYIGKMIPRSDSTTSIDLRPQADVIPLHRGRSSSESADQRRARVQEIAFAVRAGTYQLRLKEAAERLTSDLVREH